MYALGGNVNLLGKSCMWSLDSLFWRVLNNKWFEMMLPEKKTKKMRCILGITSKFATKKIFVDLYNVSLAHKGSLFPFSFKLKWLFPVKCSQTRTRWRSLFVWKLTVINWRMVVDRSGTAFQVKILKIQMLTQLFN